jgi:predicted transcriptional regulator
MSDETVREMSARLARWDRNRISDLIKKRREAGLTQADVAKILGVSRLWVHRFEKYDNDPRLSDVRRYTAAVTDRSES